MIQLVQMWLRRREGQSMSEYALMLALLAILGILGLLTLGPNVEAVFDRIADYLALD